MPETEFDSTGSTTGTRKVENNSIFFNVRKEGERSKYTITIDKGFYDGQKVPLDESPESMERIRKHLVGLLSDPANCTVRDSRIAHAIPDRDQI